MATHIMAALGFHYGEEVTSRMLATSVKAEPTFIRKSLSKLAKAGLVVTRRGKNGACALARTPAEITLRDIYLASEAPCLVAGHCYPVETECPVSAHFAECMASIQAATQRSLEEALATTTLADVVREIRKRASG
ncbi:MAG: Rrf2 family transcriptional regulator [Bryobacteraceae bacterium]